MTSNKRLIHFKTKQKFNEELDKGTILDTSIVFIQDTKEIYTHGTFYNCGASDFSEIEAIVDSKQDKITDLETIRQGAAKGATALQSYTEQYQGTVQSVETSETLDEVSGVTYVKYVTQALTDEQQARSRKNINALTSYEYYVANGGILNEKQYNIMIKYLFTPFMISPNSTTIIPDELLNESKNNFFADWYWNIMRITGGEPIITTQWQNNVPYKFKGLSSNTVYTIDYANKKITPNT